MKESNNKTNKQISRARATPQQTCKQVSSARHSPVQSYAQIMQELGIPIYGLESTQKCHYNLVKDRKEGLILVSISKIAKPKSCIIFLRYREGFYNLQLQKKKGVYT